MGCFGSRRHEQPRPEQTWDAITLRDFQSKSIGNILAFVYLYFSVLLSIAVYSVDIFTAVNLLAFNKWSSSIKPALEISISKWIFSICIILSVANLLYEFILAFRVMRRANVAECYLDNLAVRLESLRWGSGQGWRRFLVFSALTKSKKGAEYIALFTYFSFQSWFRVIVCSGPRQAVNAMTLYAVYDSNLIPTNLSSVGGTLSSFFGKLDELYKQNYMQAVILSGMLFTLLIWVFTFLFLVMGVLFYVFFLWHWIPRGDGGLRGYCERKINKRLMRIVSKKMNKALMKEEERRRKADAKKALKAGATPPVSRQATLPSFVAEGSTDKLPEMPAMTRTNTMATLPQYTSRPGSPSIELNRMGQKRPGLMSRNDTISSGYAASTSSRTPLMGAAASMGRSSSPTPTVPSLPPIAASNYPPTRPGTAATDRMPPPNAGSAWGDPSMGRSASTAPTLPSLPPMAGYNNYGPPRPGTANSARKPVPNVGMDRLNNAMPTIPALPPAPRPASPTPTIPTLPPVPRAASPTPTLPTLPPISRAASPAPTLPSLPPLAPLGNSLPQRPGTANTTRDPAPTIPSLPPLAPFGSELVPRPGTSNSIRNPVAGGAGVAPSMSSSPPRSYTPVAAPAAGIIAMPSYPPLAGSPAPLAGPPPSRPTPGSAAQTPSRPGPPGPPGRFIPEDQRSMVEGRASPAPSSIYPERPAQALAARYNGPAFSPARSNTAPMRPPANQQTPQRNNTAPMPAPVSQQTPQRNNTGPMPPPLFNLQTPQRNNTAPIPPRLPADPYSRQGTPASLPGFSARNDDIESQRNQRWQ